MAYRVRKSTLKPISGGNRTRSKKITGEGIDNILDKYGPEGRDKAEVELMTQYYTNFGKCDGASHAYGPGWWDVIHRKAQSIESEKDLDEFISHMNFVALKFPCQTCRSHYQKMWMRHKSQIPSLYRNQNWDGKHFGMFMMTWKMHNEVNERIGKDLMGWADAVFIYYTPKEFEERMKVENDGDCGVACDGAV